MVSKNGDHAPDDTGRPARRGSYVPPDKEIVDVFNLLDELENLPDKAKKLPGRTYVGFDEERFYYLVLKIRANLPEDMKKAKHVARESDRIVGEARDAAVRELTTSREEAARLADSARAESNRTIDTARSQSTVLIENARDEARKVVDMARLQANQMVDQSEIVHAATARSHEIVKEAETEASEIRKGADEYAADVLGKLEAVLNKNLAVIQKGRETLSEARN